MTDNRPMNTADSLAAGEANAPGSRASPRTSAFGPRTHAALAWTAWAMSLLAVSSLAAGLDRMTSVEVFESVGWIVGILAVASIGALAGSLRRGGIQGWLLLGYGLFWAAGLFAYQTLRSAAPGTLDIEAARWTIASADVAYVLALHSLLLLLIVVPTGHLKSTRWRPMVWVVAASLVIWGLESVALAHRVTDLEAWLGRSSIALTAGAELSSGEILLLDVAQPITASVLLIPVGGLLVARVRSARGEERQQLKWVAASGIVFLMSLALSLPAPTGWMVDVQRLLPGLASAFLAIGFGFAIFRYRLWDVDLVVRKSLAYGLIWLAIAVAYVAVATGMGLLATGATFPIEVALGLTVLATLVFQPARRWVERAADRWLFGRRSSPLEAIQALSEVAGSAERPREVAVELAELAVNAVGVASAEVVIDTVRQAVVGSPTDVAAIVIPLTRGEEQFGELRCRMGRGRELTPDDRALLGALAGQAALALSHVRLSSRIVAAQDEERRRLERDIHDGAQQDLVALIVRLGIERANAKGRSVDVEALAAIQRETQRILGDLRELAQGIHSSVLRDGGLVAAIEDRCSRLPIDVTVHATPAARRRFSPEMEAAAYFFVTEGLANTLKHSGADAVHIAVHTDERSLEIAVADNGCGFAVGHLVRGSGLSGLSDRIRALGGTLRVDSRPGAGVRLTANLPAVALEVGRR